MIPAAFEYSRPTSLDEALRLIASNTDAKVLAGGQSLLPLLKLRLASAASLVDIGRVAELRGISKGADGSLTIGALTTYRQLLESEEAMSRGCLAEAVPHIADIQVRNRGTIGGSVAHADPASDMPAVLLALDATVVVRSAKGERRIPATSFFMGAFETSLAEGEILTAIMLPPVASGTGSTYRKFEQPASGYSIVGVAAVVAKNGGSISSASIAITGVGDIAYRASAVEKALTGTDGSTSPIAAAAAHATDGQTVASDIHADAAYRGQMAAVYVRRAIEAAIQALG